MPNDQFPANQLQSIAMTLSEIIANRPQNRAIARATDIPGADLQWMYTTAYLTGVWYGDLGELGTTAFRDALFTGYLAIGVTCKVSGVPYSWGGVTWNYMGSGPQYVGTNIPLSGSYIGQKLQVDNAAVPGGRSIIWWTGSQWETPPGELIVGLYGALLDITAAALSLGVWTEVWQSAVIPDYMILNCRAISITSEANVSDPSSTAAERLRLRIASGPYSAGDENDSLLGHIQTGSPFGRGLSGVRARGNIRSGTMYGCAGAGAFNNSTQPSRVIGSIGAGATRIRLDFSPGATTNTLKLYSVELYAGA